MSDKTTRTTLLHTLKTKINGHEVNILLDPGSTDTAINSTLMDKIPFEEINDEINLTNESNES